ncbi:DUF6575 domain-containing protein [Deinococcus aestuarii]|uniref:DUF6575 domain-containing protein n=1 Tax=Deinococcus aestuarii TaxID=2774531 RepID=UPI001C0D878F|nr:DUF6575 domain-containing protein [Deinococcus aestuarii]
MTATFIPTVGHLTVQKVYVQLDQPLLFSAKNEMGDLYLLSYASMRDDGELWMVVRITQRRLSQFERAEIDIRSVFGEPELAAVLMVEFFDDEAERTQISWLQPGDEQLEAHLPDAGIKIKPIVKPIEHKHSALGHVTYFGFVSDVAKELRRGYDVLSSEVKAIRAQNITLTGKAYGSRVDSTRESGFVINPSPFPRVQVAKHGVQGRRYEVRLGSGERGGTLVTEESVSTSVWSELGKAYA